VILTITKFNKEKKSESHPTLIGTHVCKGQLKTTTFDNKKTYPFKKLPCGLMEVGKFKIHHASFCQYKT
jgi:hypothetical protein